MTKRDWLFVACEAGHDWKMVGGCNCGCEDGACSIPVYQCTRCGDFDYGDNEEAREIKLACFERRDDPLRFDQ
jgi:hypothetical protein